MYSSQPLNEPSSSFLIYRWKFIKLNTQIPEGSFMLSTYLSFLLSNGSQMYSSCTEQLFTIDYHHWLLVIIQNNNHGHIIKLSFILIWSPLLYSSLMCAFFFCLLLRWSRTSTNYRSYCGLIAMALSCLLYTYFLLFACHLSSVELRHCTVLQYLSWSK